MVLFSFVVAVVIAGTSAYRYTALGIDNHPCKPEILKVRPVSLFEVFDFVFHVAAKKAGEFVFGRYLNIWE
jgi:hypothetical protein